MTVKLFWKEDCPRCPAAKKTVSGLENVLSYDIGEVDGLAEAAFYGVMSTPSIVITDSNEKEVASWCGTVPSRQELLAELEASQ